MIIKTIALSSALAACPAASRQPAACVRVEPVAPARHAPELPEQREPDHPAHEDPSQMYRGLVYSNGTSSAVTVDSGASGFGARFPSSIWPENNLIIVSSVDDLQVISERLVPIPELPKLNVSPKVSKHMPNPSTIQIRKSITRRQR